MSLVTAKMKALNAKFVEACFDGLHKDAERLLSEGAYIESVERNGYSALSEACIAGHTIVAGHLLRALADPNSKAHDGRTPLHRAAFHGWQPVISLLLDHGADPTIRDESGMSAADLARTPLVRMQIKDFPSEKTEAAKQERKRKLAERPPPPVPKFVEDQAPAALDNEATAANSDSGTADTGFEPPLRGSAAEKEAEKVAAKAKAEAKKMELVDKAKADKERREQRYKEAMAELNELVENGQELGESGYNIADAPRPLTAKVEVKDAGEIRLNGYYQVQFATKDRVEFTKVDDELCQIFWSSWQDEWRMLIGDYKMGSTLYRNNYRPNWKADPCHGCPESNWQKWFGKDGTPTVRLIPEPVEGEAADEGSAPEGVELVEQTGTSSELAVNADVLAEGKPEKIETTRTPNEYLELHSNLNIVSVDDGGASQNAAFSTLHSSVRGNEIQLTLGGERIVETADGLFAANEVEVEDKTETATDERDQEESFGERKIREAGRSTRLNRAIPRLAEADDHCVVLRERLASASSKPLPAPRTSSDVEKALLTTLDKSTESQLAYVREHLPVTVLKRFYKRCPLGPDMLARLIRICSDLVEVDAQHAEDLVCALAAVPSSKTDAAMFDAVEQDLLQRLNSRLGSKATEAWAD